MQSRPDILVLNFEVTLNGHIDLAPTIRILFDLTYSAQQVLFTYSLTYF